MVAEIRLLAAEITQAGLYLWSVGRLNGLNSHTNAHFIQSVLGLSASDSSLPEIILSFVRSTP